MKKFLIALNIVIWSLVSYEIAQATPETEKVCIKDEKTKKEIAFILERFKHREKVLSVKEAIKVDDAVPGCPMIESMFLQALDKYFKLFGVE